MTKQPPKNANGNNPKIIPASIHFKQLGHNFNKHAKFTFIEQIHNTINTDINIIKIRPKRRENFWTLLLETVAPKGLLQELNNI